MDINMTQLVAQFLPPQFQAYFFIIAAIIYVAGNAIMPFLSKYKFNGWEHMLYMAFQDLKVDQTTQQVSFKIPDDQMKEIKAHLAGLIPDNATEHVKQEPVKQTVSVPDQSAAPQGGVTVIKTQEDLKP